MIVRMWEVGAYPEGHADLLGWVCDVAVPELEADMGHLHSEVFTAPDHRIMVVTRWRGEPRELTTPPSHLVKTAPKYADFSAVDR